MTGSNRRPLVAARLDADSEYRDQASLPAFTALTHTLLPPARMYAWQVAPRSRRPSSAAATAAGSTNGLSSSRVMAQPESSKSTGGAWGAAAGGAGAASGAGSGGGGGGATGSGAGAGAGRGEAGTTGARRAGAEARGAGPGAGGGYGFREPGGGGGPASAPTGPVACGWPPPPLAASVTPSAPAKT